MAYSKISSYQGKTAFLENDWISDPTLPDPDNLPEPLGWQVLVRPYPVKTQTNGGIILVGDTVEEETNACNIGRIVKVGPCCWNERAHLDNEGTKDWVPKEGDFITFARYKGLRRSFKGVTYVLLNDDDLLEKLPDPRVFDDTSVFSLNIPQEDLEKYNTIHNPNYCKGE